MSKVIIPVASGAFSALGMLLGKQQSEFSRSRRFALQDNDTAAEMQQLFMQMQDEAVAQMQGLALTFERHVDMRYIGQGFHLTMACPDDDLEQLKQRFEQAHMQAYGHQLNRDVEIMTVRLSAFVERPLPVLPELCTSTEVAHPVAHSEIYGVGRVPHFMRADLKPGLSYEGPMLVLEDIATLWLARGWQMQVSTHGHLLLEKIDANQLVLEAVDV